VDTGGDGLGGIERNVVADAGREGGESSFMRCVDRGGGLHGVRAGQLIDGHDAGGAWL
jgi:hypothetical protein